MFRPKWRLRERIAATLIVFASWILDEQVVLEPIDPLEAGEVPGPAEGHDQEGPHWAPGLVLRVVSANGRTRVMDASTGRRLRATAAYFEHTEPGERPKFTFTTFDAELEAEVRPELPDEPAEDLPSE
ncbi:hypothetical protein [Singulisphaera sp. PoT]|uniref:hypothetical protein n=1 Tax=Singulisphaera sp. PoT TaxID=3411797 RepID=UPI003BF58454